MEFCNDNTWGTVCDDSWDDLDASVVCRQLGFSSNFPRSFFEATFGQGTGPILLDEVACVGTENRLIECNANPIGTNDCSHSEDAGVMCQPLSTQTPGTGADPGGVLNLCSVISTLYSLGFDPSLVDRYLALLMSFLFSPMPSRRQNFSKGRFSLWKHHTHLLKTSPIITNQEAQFSTYMRFIIIVAY